MSEPYKEGYMLCLQERNEALARLTAAEAALTASREQIRVLTESYAVVQEYINEGRTATGRLPQSTVAIIESNIRGACARVAALAASSSAAVQEAGAGEAVTEAGKLLYAAANAHFWAAEDGAFDENDPDHDPEKDKVIHQGLAVAMNRWMAAMGNKTAQAMLTPAPPAPRRSAPISAESTLFAEQTADAESGYDGPPAPRPGEQEADGA